MKKKKKKKKKGKKNDRCLKKRKKRKKKEKEKSLQHKEMWINFESKIEAPNSVTGCKLASCVRRARYTGIYECKYEKLPPIIIQRAKYN